MGPKSTACADDVVDSFGTRLAPQCVLCQPDKQCVNLWEKKKRENITLGLRGFAKLEGRVPRLYLGVKAVSHQTFLAAQSGMGEVPVQLHGTKPGYHAYSSAWVREQTIPTYALTSLEPLSQSTGKTGE